MFVELLDKLRCPNPHDDSPLIAASTRTVDRRIVEGALGCPLCRAEYAVHNGAVDFGREPREPEVESTRPPAERALRLGALLGLDERGGLYVLDAGAARHIGELEELSPSSQFIALGAGEDVAGAGIVIRNCGGVLPLAKECARGVALDSATPDFLASAVRALAAGGRLIAPAGAVVPDAIKVLARDDEQWVGERDAIPVISTLRRAPRG